MERIKEKPTKARSPWKLTDGISNHLFANPGYVKAKILKSFTTSVTRYKTTAEDTQRKRPYVIILRGRSNKFMTGFATSEVTVRPIPANRRVYNPLSNTIPEAAR